MVIVRAQVIHTPRDPFAEGEGALEAFSDGAVAIGGDGRILTTGDFASVSADYPDAPVADRRGSVLLPGLVDTHVQGPGDDVGDLDPGKAADLVLISPPEGSTLAAVLRHSDTAEEVLGAVFALARDESVAEVRVEGDVVFERG